MTMGMRSEIPVNANTLCVIHYTQIGAGQPHSSLSITPGRLKAQPICHYFDDRLQNYPTFHHPPFIFHVSARLQN